MNKLFSLLKKIIPKKILDGILPMYHYMLAFLGALRYGFPSRKIIVIGVTGTKGKSSTTEILNSILEDAGYITALTNGIRFKTATTSKPNTLKMTMPGRFLIQKHIYEATKQGCTHFILEMTSEGAKQFRHKWIDLDVLVFTNLSPEHIESHGSYENYLNAKLSIGKALEVSRKTNKAIIANADDKESGKFLALHVEKKIPFSLEDAKPYEITSEEILFTFEKKSLHSPLEGKMNLYNILAAVVTAQHLGVHIETIEKSLKTFKNIPGRVQHIEEGQNFDVIVDYAHTPESLEQLYETFRDQKKICVLGNTGGGRDTWKRPKMAQIADTYCKHIILTNEDPYDEDPRKILDEMLPGIKSTPVEIIMDRREAIHKAVQRANDGDVVLLSGKGTDPYIMGPNGTKEPWSDARIAKEELKKIM